MGLREAIRTFRQIRREYWQQADSLVARHPDCTRATLNGYYWSWLASIYLERSPLSKARPWITFAATRFLEHVLSDRSRVFEYGAGGSTLFFAERVAELVTVEHDPKWLARTAAKLPSKRKPNWRPHLSVPVRSAHPDRFPPIDPEAYASSAAEFAGMSFRGYASVIDQYEDNSFDVVLIDGRARPSCFKHAIPKVKFGGYIVVDNAEREQYAWVEQAATRLGFAVREFWGPGPYNRYFWRTIFLQRVKDRFALNDLDKKLERYLDFDGGTFVEAGANDGVSQSNTLYFESRRGWHGLLIEPAPDLVQECRRFRPHAIVEQAALVGPDRETDEVTLRYANLMSTVKGGMRTAAEEDAHIASGCEVQKIATYEFQAPGATLSSLLDKHGIRHVDLLSLDVEGYELSALKGLDLARHRPRFILVEARYRDEVHAYLAERYERVAELSHHDLLYRLKFDTGPGQQARA